MRYLIIFLFCFPAMAKMKYHLVPCAVDNTQLCKIGKSQGVPDSVCQIQKNDDARGSDYTATIVEIPDGFFGKFIDLIGLGNSRAWGPDEVVADNEKIICTLDESKVEARLDAKAALEATEKAKKDKLKSDWAALCAAPKDGIETLLCTERGY